MITEETIARMKQNLEVKNEFCVLDYIKQLETQNAEMKEQIEELQLNLRSRNDLVEDLTRQNEKMKNFYNCSHSSRALCPNEHKCNGCKDWELAE